MPEEEPKPLALEAPKDPDQKSDQLDIDVKKKVQEKKTTVNYRDNSFLKKVMETPKEGPGGDTGTASSSSSSSVPKEDIKVVQERLLSEQKQYEGEETSLEDCEDSAEFIIELVDTVLMLLIQWYSMDSNDKEYQIEEKRKTKLKKYLAKILVRMGKKYPLGIMFFVMFLATYVPAARKAHSHRGQVQEEKATQAKKKAEEAKSSAPPDPPRRRRRRASEMIEDAQYTEEKTTNI